MVTFDIGVLGIMPLRKDAPGADLNILKEWEHGFTWMAHPDEDLQRSSQAIEVSGDVWLVDAMDADGLDKRLADLGEVAGVVMLGNHHERHMDRIAQRHDVAVHVPEWFHDSSLDFDAPVVRFDSELGETGFELLFLRDNFFRQEGALYHSERKTLVVSDTLMSAVFTAEPGRVELFPPARLVPTYDALRGLEVDRLLLSHGDPVFDDVEDQIDRALAQEYRSTFSAVIGSVPFFARFALLVMRR